MCRYEAKRLWSQHEQFQANGIKAVCVLHQWDAKEVEAFAPAFWGGPVYLDCDKKFYRALGHGKVQMLYMQSCDPTGLALTAQLLLRYS